MVKGLDVMFSREKRNNSDLKVLEYENVRLRGMALIGSYSGRENG